MTKVWHNKTYAAIDPKKPSLSAANKTVFITGKCLQRALHLRLLLLQLMITRKSLADRNS